MVSQKTVGGLLAGSALLFAGILYFTIQSLTARTQVLGCILDTPGCAQVATGLSMSHVAVGFVSAVFSLGVYFFFFHKEVSEKKLSEQRIELLTKVLTAGEKEVLAAVLHQEGILQSSLAYKTNLTPGRVSQVLSQFEEQGLIRRVPSGKSFKVYAAV